MCNWKKKRKISDQLSDSDIIQLVKCDQEEIIEPQEETEMVEEKQLVSSKEAIKYFDGIIDYFEKSSLMEDADCLTHIKDKLLLIKYKTSKHQKSIHFFKKD